MQPGFGVCTPRLLEMLGPMHVAQKTADCMTSRCRPLCQPTDVNANLTNHLAANTQTATGLSLIKPIPRSPGEGELLTAPSLERAIGSVHRCPCFSTPFVYPPSMSLARTTLARSGLGIRSIHTCEQLVLSGSPATSLPTRLRSMKLTMCSSGACSQGVSTQAGCGDQLGGDCGIQIRARRT
jgi:hypothetical protein